VTAGTVLHNSKTPLMTWFWAAYLITTDKRGLSALFLQRQLGSGRYETAWMILHKLRRAMVNTGREPLYDKVELDQTWVGGPQAGLKGSRQLRGRKDSRVSSRSPLPATATSGERNRSESVCGAAPSRSFRLPTG